MGYQLRGWTSCIPWAEHRRGPVRNAIDPPPIASHPARSTARSAGAGLAPRATDTYRPPPPPLLPPFAEALSTVSTQPTTLPATRYTSTRFPNPQRGLPEG